MSKPTKLQTRILREMIEATPGSWYGARRTARLAVSERTINAMIRNGWIREIDNATIEITPAGVRAYPVPLVTVHSGLYRNVDTGVVLRRGRRDEPQWVVEVGGRVVNGDSDMVIARKQAQFMATTLLVKRVREADQGTIAQWTAGSEWVSAWEGNAAVRMLTDQAAND